MSALPHRIIVLARLDEGGLRIKVPFVEDGVNGHSKEITVGRDDSLVGIQYRRLAMIVIHPLLKKSKVFILLSSSVYRHNAQVCFYRPEFRKAGNSIGKPSCNAWDPGKKESLADPQHREMPMKSRIMHEFALDFIFIIIYS